MQVSYPIADLVALQAFVHDLVKHLPLGSLLTLSGPLGVGKTTLVQALAKVLGVVEKVNSPTFTIMKVYRFPHGRLLHLDAYRLEGQQDLGIEDEMGEDTITVMEWPERLSTLPRVNVHVHLTLSFVNNHARMIVMERKA
jgi:tRNA threonylcarbamoyladenosine biosynthesis protein TsaE